jgi:hypothetical protein
MKKRRKSRKKRTLFVQHLEKVAPDILQEYPEVIKELIRRRHGIYALYRGDTLYYVGLARDLTGRVKTHLKDRHKGAWNRFSVYLTLKSDHMKELESLLIRIVRPRANKAGGRFATSEDLLKTVHRRAKELDDDRRAAMLGGWIARRRVQRRTRREKGSDALVNAFARSTQLRGYRNGKTFTATLRRDGQIRYRRRLYSSPSRAGGAAIKGPCNGWHFWHYKAGRKGWVELRMLRR